MRHLPHAQRPLYHLGRAAARELAERVPSDTTKVFDKVFDAFYHRRQRKPVQTPSQRPNAINSSVLQDVRFLPTLIDVTGGRF